MQSGLEQIDNDLQAYQSALGDVIAPPVPPRLVGAGNMFMSLGRFEEALAIYQALTRGAPAMSYAWLNLGICQLELEQTEQALASLTAATEMLPKNAYSWLWLSRALAQNDQPNDARQAYERAKSINADTARAFGNPLDD
jgi:tetratricopeptide (TPR) repeat protein